jgi:hypothetical protein
MLLGLQRNRNEVVNGFRSRNIVVQKEEPKTHVPVSVESILKQRDFIGGITSTFTMF